MLSEGAGDSILTVFSWEPLRANLPTSFSSYLIEEVTWSGRIGCTRALCFCYNAAHAQGGSEKASSLRVYIKYWSIVTFAKSAQEKSRDREPTTQRMSLVVTCQGFSNILHSIFSTDMTTRMCHDHVRTGNSKTLNFQYVRDCDKVECCKHSQISSTRMSSIRWVAGSLFSRTLAFVVLCFAYESAKIATGLIQVCYCKHYITMMLCMYNIIDPALCLVRLIPAEGTQRMCSADPSPT